MFDKSIYSHVLNMSVLMEFNGADIGPMGLYAANIKQALKIAL